MKKPSIVTTIILIRHFNKKACLTREYDDNFAARWAILELRLAS